MKKVLTLLVAVVAIMVCVVGCGEGNSSSSNLLTFDEYITKYNEYCANELEEDVNREKERGFSSGDMARESYSIIHPLYPLSRDLFVEDETATISGQYYYTNSGRGLSVSCTTEDEDLVYLIRYAVVFSEEDYSGPELAYNLILSDLKNILYPFWEDTTEAVNIFTELNEELIDSGAQYASREEEGIRYNIDIQEADGRIGVIYSVDFVH